MEKEQDKRANWGGSRPGAGRKRKTAKRYGFNADERVTAILEQVPDKTAFITEAVLLLAAKRGIKG